MELPDIQRIEMQDLDRWFTTMVDVLNYNFGQIEAAVVALDNELTTIDTSPIQYLKNSLNKLVDNLNASFEKITTTMMEMDKRISALEDGQNGI